MAGGVGRPGDAEVGQLHQPVLADQDVGRLDVAVDDLGLVGDPECQRALADHRANLFGRERAVVADQLREGFAVDELHDEEGEALVLAVVEERGDVGVDQRRGVQRLVTEPKGEQLLVVGVGTHHLQRDAALQDVVLRGPHVGHAA